MVKGERHGLRVAGYDRDTSRDDLPAVLGGARSSAEGRNRYDEAVQAFDRALGLAGDAAVRRQLLDRLTEISLF